uniref:Uncharacterized protein n=1 Tax=Sphaerodactylus townsendi TaxID=933632 RepID=A0ACB8FJS4_9SAUR
MSITSCNPGFKPEDARAYLILEDLWNVILYPSASALSTVAERHDAGDEKKARCVYCASSGKLTVSIIFKREAETAKAKVRMCFERHLSSVVVRLTAEGYVVEFSGQTCSIKKQRESLCHRYTAE